jgi:hypothetical protein
MGNGWEVVRLVPKTRGIFRKGGNRRHFWGATQAAIREAAGGRL